MQKRASRFCLVRITVKKTLGGKMPITPEKEAVLLLQVEPDGLC